MDNRRLLMRLARGESRNVRFADLCRLVEALGFELRRVRAAPPAGAPISASSRMSAGQARPSRTRLAGVRGSSGRINADLIMRLNLSVDGAVRLRHVVVPIQYVGGIRRA